MGSPVLKDVLDDVRARCDVAARRARDPVSFVHRYVDADDQEIVALVAASVAFGNVTTICAKLEDLLARLALVAPTPSRAADDPRALRAACRGWVHRVYRGEDVARLLAGARAVQREHGSLGARFASDMAATNGELRAALTAFCDALREAGGFNEAPSRGLAHLLADPRGASAAKRLHLFLRWMIRPADGVDLGLWARHGLSPAVLLVPVDTHVHKLARNLGLVRGRTLTWRTAETITGRLARFDAADPVKYDFSLCHLGMVQRCKERRAPACEGCSVRPVCRHWRGR